MKSVCFLDTPKYHQWLVQGSLAGYRKRNMVFTWRFVRKALAHVLGHLLSSIIALLFKKKNIRFIIKHWCLLSIVPLFYYFFKTSIVDRNSIYWIVPYCFSLYVLNCAVVSCRLAKILGAETIELNFIHRRWTHFSWTLPENLPGTFLVQVILFSIHPSGRGDPRGPDVHRNAVARGRGRKNGTVQARKTSSKWWSVILNMVIIA